jgi:hypothetical protein
MRKPIIIVLVLAVMAIAGLAVSFIAVFAMKQVVGGLGHANLEVRAKIVVGNQLRMVVETYRSYRPIDASSLRTADAKGYLIIVDLAGENPLADRATVFGPLWDVPNPRSNLSFTAGANFTKQDVEAAKATPMCVFDENGALLRFIRDPSRQTLVRDAFIDDPNGGSWERQGDLKPMLEDFLKSRRKLDVMNMRQADFDRLAASEDRVATPSKRFVLFYRDGTAALFDAFTGDAKDDPWLTTCFKHAHSIKDFTNLRTYLTNDLNHLVVCPEPTSGTAAMLLTFKLDGKTYKRSEVGLAYIRPTLAPTIFSNVQKRLFGRPHGAVSIDGELYLFMNEENELILYSPDGKKTCRVAATDPGFDLQHVPADDEIILFQDEVAAFVNSVIHEKGQKKTFQPDNNTLSVIRWKYRENTITRDDTRIIDLFEQSGGELRPRAVIGVR